KFAILKFLLASDAGLTYNVPAYFITSVRDSVAAADPFYFRQAGPPGCQTKGFGKMAFTFTNSYLQNIYEGVCKKNSHEPEFLQAVGEVLETLQPVFAK